MIVLDYMWNHLLFPFPLHYGVFWQFCTEDAVQAPLPYNNENTDSSSTSIAQIYLDFSMYKSSILKSNFEYISEKHVKPISEKYIKSILSYF